MIELIPNFFESAGALGWWVSLALTIFSLIILLRALIWVVIVIGVIFVFMFSFVMALINKVTP